LEPEKGYKAEAEVKTKGAGSESRYEPNYRKIGLKKIKTKIQRAGKMNYLIFLNF